MPPAPTHMSAPAAQNNERSFERLFLVILFFITITQFSAFGYQSVMYVLGLIFNVSVIATPLDVVIGITAMVASALVFAGAAMWWRMMPAAQPFFSIGALLFIGKNVLDLVNETILFGMKNQVVDATQIQQLAGILAGQFFQMAFWILVFFYFRYIIKRALKV